MKDTQYIHFPGATLRTIRTLIPSRAPLPAADGILALCRVRPKELSKSTLWAAVTGQLLAGRARSTAAWPRVNNTSRGDG